MITREHESGIDLYELFPTALATVLDICDVDIPPDPSLDFHAARFTELEPSELNADSLVLVSADGTVKLAVIIEVQRDGGNGKQASWPRYVTGAWSRHSCPVVLLVHCPDDAYADSCARPIHMGPAGTITPTVFSPRQVPLIDDPTAWDGDIGVALVSAFMHARGDRYVEVMRATSEILARIDTKQAETYTATLNEILPIHARELCEHLMTTHSHAYQNAFVRFEERGKAKGMAEGKVKGTLIGERNALLLVLRSRGFDLTDVDLARIDGCSDIEQINRWLSRVAIITELTELFD